MEPAPKKTVAEVAPGIAADPVVARRPEQWGLLTAVSAAAKERKQGQDIILYRKEHLLGRLVPDTHYKFDLTNVSGKHCKVFLETRKTEEGEETVVLVQDSSSNGTFINGVRLEKGGTPLVLQNADILSLVGVPDADAALAYVFRAVNAIGAPLPAEQIVAAKPQQPAPAPVRQPAPKRKPSPPASGVVGSEQPSEGKRARAGDGAADVVRLDDMKRLQRSNEELTRGKEAQQRTIEALKADMRSAEQKHQEEKAEMEKGWKAKLEQAQAEAKEHVAGLERSKAAQSQQQSAIEDLQRRLEAAGQSRKEADEAIKNHLTTINELTRGLDNERKARAAEKLQAEDEQKAAVEKVRAEAQAELARKTEGAEREKEEQAKRLQQLQDTEKEIRTQNESLRAKLEQQRELLVGAQEQERRLQARVAEERAGTGAQRAQLEAAQAELRKKEDALQLERAQRVQAESSVKSLSTRLEEMTNKLAFETERLHGLKDRILVRETQLRAFHSTTAKAFPLLQTMMEQLDTMRSVSKLSAEDEQEITRSGGEGSKGTVNPPEANELAEGGEDDTGNSPLRRDEEMADAEEAWRDVNMTQLEEDEEFVLSTAPVRRTPQKTPPKSLRVASPAQRGSASKTPGLRAGLASPGGVSRALKFGQENGGTSQEEEQEGSKDLGREGGMLGEVFAKPADREPVQKTPGKAENGEEEQNGGELEGERKQDADKETQDEEEIEKEQEGRNGIEGKEKSQDESQRGKDESEKVEGEGLGPRDQETLLMEDDVIGTVPATYAVGTLLMEEPEGGELGSLEGGLGTGKSAPLAQIPEEVEEGEIRDDEEGGTAEGQEFTQLNNGATQAVGKLPEGENEEEVGGEEKETAEDGAVQNGERAGGSEAQADQTPRNEAPRGGKDSLENGQPPESFQMSEYADGTPRGGSDAFELTGSRRVSLGDPLKGLQNRRESTGGRRESLLEKMDLIMDADFTDTEKGVPASPAAQGATQLLSNSQRAKHPSPDSVLPASPKRGAISSLLAAGIAGGWRKGGSDGFWAGLNLNDKPPPASAPAGPRPVLAGASPSTARALFRRKSSEFLGDSGSEPGAKRFKAAGDDDVVQDSGSQRTADGGLRTESVARKRGGSSEEKEPLDDASGHDDDVGEGGDDDDPPARPARELVSSQRSVSGKALESAPSPASVSIGNRRGPVEDDIDGAAQAEEADPEAPQGPVETQATGNDLAGGGESDPFRVGGFPGPGSAPLPSSLAGLQCSEALTSARTADFTESPVEPTPAAMPPPTVPPPAPKARTPRQAERVGRGGFGNDPLAGLDVMLDIMRPAGDMGESLQSDGRVGDSEIESEDEDLLEEGASDYEGGERGAPVGTEVLANGRGG
ncbi:hypothetical protein KFL_000290300 [Klebsormidium nitens]|uniref:FHA domain-containing protein n=1 Tax=Klebsormidium nitens TaxID=105231 RepID=A0A1Y1HL91_KLENI|nr:hypothetical protein KFL_000290300 [Klebsormidium nitens]|eukprot:GAQ79380.1 hypothetical protein KFL_000290300 [Klebsormidium nitens]